MSNTFSQNIDKISKKAIPLAEAQLGADYTITQCNLPNRLLTRFSELGFVKGSKVTIVQKAPMGDPLEVSIMGYRVCARANELKYIMVTRTDNE